VLRSLVAEGGAYVAPGGLLALEVGAGQAGLVVAEIETAGGYGDVRVRKDLAGRERVVLARRAGARPKDN
jgi:release factor glutamine methyltransferase